MKKIYNKVEEKKEISAEENLWLNQLAEQYVSCEISV